jgi:hypothetical protein
VSLELRDIQTVQRVAELSQYGSLLIPDDGPVIAKVIGSPFEVEDLFAFFFDHIGKIYGKYLCMQEGASEKG